jgi:glycosyltransferase involved in cell wall biosynthesis
MLGCLRRPSTVERTVIRSVLASPGRIEGRWAVVAEARPILYATSARIGGSGLDAVALESLRTLEEAGVDWRALAFENRSTLPAKRIKTLRWHPVRLLSGLGSEYYYGAKKHALDRAAASRLGRRDYALFHGWSGECVRTLRRARERGVPSLIEIPTWHRHKGKSKPTRLTKSEREAAAARGWQGFKNGLLVSRQQMLEEYDLADRILVLSERAEETFLAAGVPKEKLFRHHRGVDVERFTPAEKRPSTFRAIFVGALIERKGVHHLLRVWRRLALPDAELVLVGAVHPEIEPVLRECAHPSIVVRGFVQNVAAEYQAAAVHVFPSECEGSAKCTYEAAACGLPQITTREAGDVVQPEVNGLIIPPNDPDALAAALERLYRDRDLAERLGTAGRRRVCDHFTWSHFRRRLLQAYAELGISTAP